MLTFVPMDHDLELQFQALVKELDELFGGELDVQAILFLIGVNELGIGYKDFSKSEKTDLMHVAICTVLEPYGFYSYESHDKDNWPHFKMIKKLPRLDSREQQHLLKEAIIDYFDRKGYSDLSTSSI